MERFRIGVGFNDEANLSNQPHFPQGKKPGGGVKWSKERLLLVDISHQSLRR